MDRKTFFKSTAGIVVVGIFGKQVIESLKTEKSDAEKMLNGAKAVDGKFESDIIELHRLNDVGRYYIHISDGQTDWYSEVFELCDLGMESLMKRVIVQDGDGWCYLNTK